MSAFTYSLSAALQQSIDDAAQRKANVVQYLADNKKILLDILTSESNELADMDPIRGYDFIKPEMKSFTRSFSANLNERGVIDLLAKLKLVICDYAQAHDNDETSRELLYLFQYFNKKMSYIQALIQASAIPIITFAYENRESFFDEFNERMDSVFPVSNLYNARDVIKGFVAALQAVGNSGATNDVELFD